MPLKYKGTKIIYTRLSLDEYSNLLIPILKRALNDINARTEIVGSKIIFNRIIDSGKKTGYEGFKIIRAGEINLTQIEENKIRIAWEVNLNTLIFLSVLLGFIAGLYFKTINNVRLDSAIIIGFSAWVIFFLFGYYWIRKNFRFN
ncbi:MAG: hypothetical protein A2033_14525 [Bacteroidetes bacterium GWA2_31_9]|nr:MAG: hypothetical protein A2033_14525 [Bacteroidetes bacterium GWA2_31_9]